MTAQQIGTNWYPYYIEISFAASDTVVAVTMMSFWIGIASMRLLSSFLLSRGFSPVKLSAIGMLISGLAQVIASVSGNLVLSLVFIAISGFAAGANVPCYVVEVSSWYRNNTFFVSTFYLLCGTAGRMVMQPIAAALAEAWGPRTMLLAASSLLFIGSVLAFFVINYRRSHKN